MQGRAGEAVQRVGAEHGTGENVEQERSEKRPIGILDVLDRLARPVTDQVQFGAVQVVVQRGAYEKPVARQQMFARIESVEQLSRPVDIAQIARRGDRPVPMEQRQAVRVEGPGHVREDEHAVVENVAADEIAEHAPVEIVDHGNGLGHHQERDSGAPGVRREYPPCAGRHSDALLGGKDAPEIVDRGSGIHPSRFAGPVDHEELELCAGRMRRGVLQDLADEGLVPRPDRPAQRGILGKRAQIGIEPVEGLVEDKAGESALLACETLEFSVGDGQAADIADGEQGGRCRQQGDREEPEYEPVEAEVALSRHRE